jgi:hypothetical protein
MCCFSWLSHVGYWTTGGEGMGDESVTLMTNFEIVLNLNASSYQYRNIGDNRLAKNRKLPL